MEDAVCVQNPAGNITGLEVEPRYIDECRREGRRVPGRLEGDGIGVKLLSSREGPADRGKENAGDVGGYDGCCNGPSASPSQTQLRHR